MSNRLQISLLILILLFMGCYESPEFSPIPEISFKQIKYVPVDGFADSLILTFKFKDGDGDIGLHSYEDLPPYHSFDHVIDANGQLITFSTQDLELPLDKIFIYEVDGLGYNQQQHSTYDPRPDVFDCEQFVYDTLLLRSFADSFVVVADTFFIVKNEFNKNVYIDFYRKLGGQYQLITDDEFSPGSSCPEGFDSRFPVFNGENIKNQRAISGTISYPMLSQGFKSIFRNDTIQVRFYIYDRALNKSNLAESRDFTLFDFQ